VEVEELKWVLALCAMLTPPAIHAASPNPVGHYYLQGVRETGSELRLKPGGRYDWYMSYGAMDLFSEGTWRRTGADVVLTVDPRNPRVAIFKLGAQQLWNERAEQKVQEPLYQARLTEVFARCPFLADSVDYVSAPRLAGEQPLDPSAALQAERAGADAIAARVLVERAAAVALSGGVDRDTKMQAATDAMKAWKLAKLRARDAHDEARIRAPDLAEPTLPDACDIPVELDPADVAPDKWIRGVAIVVSDPAVEMTFSGITVVFAYADGSLSESVDTDNGGWAIAPDRKVVNRVSLSLRGSDSRTTWLSIMPMTEGIQMVSIDSRKVLDPPFKTMTLRIDDRDLIPENRRGRYVRH
jgi:hypothetical protein